MANLKVLTIERIEVQPDRVCLYGADPDYKVIASLKDRETIQVGDTVKYEPYGMNFGWYAKP